MNTARLNCSPQIESSLYELVLEEAISGYFDWHIRDGAEYLSPAFKKMLGYEDHELANSHETWKEVIFPDDLPAVLDVLRLHIKSHGQVPFLNELRFRHKNGSTVWVLCRGKVTEWDEHGKAVRMIGCHVDITERKRSEEAMNHLCAELKATNLRLERFSSGLAHDLRTPLHQIDGFAELLLADSEVELHPATREQLQIIKQCAVKMNHMVDDLLNLARLRHQEMELIVTPLNELAEAVINDSRPQWKGRNLKWSIGSLPSMECDPGLMKLVFVNLLANAVKYTRPRQQAVIEIDQTVIDGELVVYVRDNGVGFDPQSAHRLFQAFQRLHSEKEFEGVGIGLATVHDIIEKHGGRIWAEAEPNQSTTFYFTLGPRARYSCSPKPEAVSVHASGIPRTSPDWS